MFKLRLAAILAIFVITSGVCYGQEGLSGKTSDIVLTPADQLILKAIGKVNDRIDSMGREVNDRIDSMGREVNDRIDKVNDRIDSMGRELNGRMDNLWVTMLGGFLGVMAFIGALVFWDRRTFMKRSKEGFEAEVAEDRKMIKGLIAVMKKLGEQFPQVQEVMRSYGLL